MDQLAFLQQQQYIANLEDRYLPPQRMSGVGFASMGTPIVAPPKEYGGGPLLQIVGPRIPTLHVPTYNVATYDPLWDYTSKGSSLPPTNYKVVL